jgi:hypothetical protein
MNLLASNHPPLALAFLFIFCLKMSAPFCVPYLYLLSDPVKQEQVLLAFRDHDKWETGSELLTSVPESFLRTNVVENDKWKLTVDVNHVTVEQKTRNEWKVATSTLRSGSVGKNGYELYPEKSERKKQEKREMHECNCDKCEIKL